MWYYTQADPDAAARKKIDTYRQMARCYPIIAKVAREFDNKCFNCRFEKALQDACNDFFGIKTLDDGRQVRNIGLYANKRYGRFLEIDAYVNSEDHIVAHINLDDMPDGKRIPADKIIKSAQEKRESLLQAAAQLEKDMQQVELYRSQITQIEAMLKTVVDGIGHDARQIYDLDYYVRRH